MQHSQKDSISLCEVHFQFQTCPWLKDTDANTAHEKWRSLPEYNSCVMRMLRPFSDIFRAASCKKSIKKPHITVERHEYSTNWVIKKGLFITVLIFLHWNSARQGIFLIWKLDGYATGKSKEARQKARQRRIYHVQARVWKLIKIT